MIEYVYDPVGNILEVRRSTVAGLAVFGFTPSQGLAGTVVTIQGRGFGADPVDNTVLFDGVATVVTAAGANSMVATVPAGAASGPV